MAQISINVSTKHGSSICRTPFGPFNGLAMINVETYLSEGLIYARDCVSIHGTAADIRRFAEEVIAGLPQEEPEESAESDQAVKEWERRVGLTILRAAQD